LRQDALHDEKKKKGIDFESAKLRITRGYPAPLPAKHRYAGKAASIAGAVIAASPFSIGLSSKIYEYAR
jgi:hypothetical protein